MVELITFNNIITLFSIHSFHTLTNKIYYVYDSNMHTYMEPLQLHPNHIFYKFSCIHFHRGIIQRSNFQKVITFPPFSYHS
jgi:hypothetical protein